MVRCLDGCYGNRLHSRGSLSDLSHWLRASGGDKEGKDGLEKAEGNVDRNGEEILTSMGNRMGRVKLRINITCVFRNCRNCPSHAVPFALH